MVAQAALRAEPRLKTDPLLSVRNVSVRFGGIVALDGVSFDVAPGEIAGLIGPNGAGKTTLFNCLSRLYIPNEGDILFEGSSILSEPPHAIPQLGICRTFQNVALFDRMSVLDNIKVGCHSKTATGFITNALRLPHRHGEESRITERAHELIAFMDLAAYTHAPALGLPFPVLDDGFAGRAPVFGVIAGLRAAAHDIAVFLPVDCPLVTADVLRGLGEAVAVPQTGPLPGAYGRALLPELEARVARGERSLRGVNGTVLEIDERLLANVNEPGDLARLAPVERPSHFWHF